MPHWQNVLINVIKRPFLFISNQLKLGILNMRLGGGEGGLFPCMHLRGVDLFLNV